MNLELLPQQGFPLLHISRGFSLLEKKYNKVASVLVKHECLFTDETSWDEQSSPRLRQLALSSFLVILAIAILIKYWTYLIILFYTWFEYGAYFSEFIIVLIIFILYI